jgi:hypothetical protein
MQEGTQAQPGLGDTGKIFAQQAQQQYMSTPGKAHINTHPPAAAVAKTHHNRCGPLHDVCAHVLCVLVHNSPMRNNKKTPTQPQNVAKRAHTHALPGQEGEHQTAPQPPKTWPHTHVYPSPAHKCDCTPAVEGKGPKEDCIPRHTPPKTHKTKALHRGGSSYALHCVAWGAAGILSGEGSHAQTASGVVVAQAAARAAGVRGQRPGAGLKKGHAQARKVCCMGCMARIITHVCVCHTSK